MDLTLQAIAEPKRRLILRLIWKTELSAGEIAAHFTVTRPAISQHLRVLKSAGLLTERREGTRRLYRARSEKIEELREYLGQFWEEPEAAPVRWTPERIRRTPPTRPRAPSRAR